MYEAVYVYPDSKSTVTRCAHTADRYGYDGIITRAIDAEPDFDQIRTAMDNGFSTLSTPDIVNGVEIVRSDPQHASGVLGNERSQRTIVAIRGGTDVLNRFAAEQPRVDVLTKPFIGSNKSRTGDINHVLIKAAVRNEVAIELNLGPTIRAEGGRRIKHIQRLNKLKRLIDHYDAPYVVSATPNSHLEFRTPQELAAVGAEIGLGETWVYDGFTAWDEIITRNRHRRSESFIAPGVEYGRHEKND
jgi:ribonuclease P/MRP protein subunit RPP1